MICQTDLIYFNELHADTLALLSRMHIDLCKYSENSKSPSQIYISKSESIINDFKRYVETSSVTIIKLIEDRDKAEAKGYINGKIETKKFYTGEDIADRNKEAKRAQNFANSKNKWHDHL